MKSRILIVEDMETNRELVSRWIQIYGYDVIFAENGQEAINVALKEQPDLILMDMGLPIIDGWETTRRIRKIDAIKNIPIIALTAHAMSKDREMALAAGCNEYESKPINFDNLVSKIKSLI